MLTDLYPREEMILRFLARGWNYQRIREWLKTSLANVHAHAHHIRQKTGIVDTKNPQQCRDYLREKSKRPPPKPWLKPTASMLEAMQGVAEGYSYEHLRKGCGLRSAQTVQNAVSQGCRRAGIIGQGANRTQAIREYLLRLKSMVPLDAEGMF